MRKESADLKKNQVELENLNKVLKIKKSMNEKNRNLDTTEEEISYPNRSELKYIDCSKELWSNYTEELKITKVQPCISNCLLDILTNIF